MSRVVWFAAGAVSGVYTLVKAKRTAQNLTPDGIGARVAALGLGARMFAGEVASAMATREAELRAELHLSDASRPALEPGGDAASHEPGGDAASHEPGRDAASHEPGRDAADDPTASTNTSTDGEGRHDGHR